MIKSLLVLIPPHHYKTNLVYSIEKGRQEIEKLKSGIVKNPEKLKNVSERECKGFSSN